MQQKCKQAQHAVSEKKKSETGLWFLEYKILALQFLKLSDIQQGEGLDQTGNFKMEIKHCWTTFLMFHMIEIYDKCVQSAKPKCKDNINK